jgi:cation diffusion facilitator CzcD-associated flavoprotein CzcO
MHTKLWAVIGAGPAGIAAVGRLLDHQISPKDILWIDPAFTVGDFGSLWNTVPSNTRVQRFLQFLQGSPAFRISDCQHPFELFQMPHDATCALQLMADPLHWVTDHFKNTVDTMQSMVHELHLKHRVWCLSLADGKEICAKNVILSVGAEAKTLPHSLPTIPLHDALDISRLKNHIQNNETIAVFGSSHSAILVLKNLIENSASQIINFYRSPLVYATYLDDWILFDDAGLKSTTAEWARENLDGVHPKNLTRVYSDETNIKKYLPQCQKVVYAIGFERRKFPVVTGFQELNYIQQTGIIAPGLFGFGIAFPEVKSNPLGIPEHRVGLAKFMDYLHRVMPLWLKYGT